MTKTDFFASEIEFFDTRSAGGSETLRQSIGVELPHIVVTIGTLGLMASLAFSGFATAFSEAVFRESAAKVLTIDETASPSFEEEQERAAQEYRAQLDRSYERDAFDAQWVWD